MMSTQAIVARNGVRGFSESIVERVIESLQSDGFRFRPAVTACRLQAVRSERALATRLELVARSRSGVLESDRLGLDVSG